MSFYAERRMEMQQVLKEDIKGFDNMYFKMYNIFEDEFCLEIGQHGMRLADLFYDGETKDIRFVNHASLSGFSFSEVKDKESDVYKDYKRFFLVSELLLGIDRIEKAMNNMLESKLYKRFINDFK